MIKKMLASTKSQEIPAIRVNTGRQPSKIVWQSRYEGCAAVAYVHGKAIAGISGPWSDKYALTWWAHPAARQLELFDSLEAARHEVEQRARHTSSSRLTTLLRALRHNSAAVTRNSWLSHVHAVLTRRNRERPQHDAVVQLRQYRQRQDTDLSGMHFHAFE
ncbi:MAG: hypothetical protein P4L92_13055 [Rudaea sp.]|nr:hypothetical protein [Rudaea sp.]